MGMICMSPEAPEGLWAPGVHLDSHHITRSTVGHCVSSKPASSAVVNHSAHRLLAGAVIGAMVVPTGTVVSTRTAGCSDVMAMRTAPSGPKIPGMETPYPPSLVVDAIRLSPASSPMHPATSR